jgi:hypothetical protein
LEGVLWAAFISLSECLVALRRFDVRTSKRYDLKAAHTNRSISDIVNDAVRCALREDQEDLAAFEDRVAEPEISYEALLKDLKAHGKL